jgi:DNA repair exonuclease SbcCD nuclease subunit
MRAAHVGEVAARVREERLAAARRVVAAAVTGGAEFLLVAGDTFEDHAVGGTLVQKTGEILAAFPGPVYLLPGNHDPLVPGSVWEHPVFAGHENLIVLTEAEPIPLAGGTLHPCPVREKHSRVDPTRVLPTSGEGIRIGVAHGTVEGVPMEVPDFPIPRDAAARACLDYLALGHWHSHATYPDEDGVVRMAYAGAHEPTKFGERDSGTAVLVSIDAPGAAPVLSKVETGGLTWFAGDFEIREAGDLEDVLATIEGLSEPDRTLVRVRLSGLLPAASSLERIATITTTRFLHGKFDDEDLLPSPEDDSWLDELPEGVVRVAAERLREMTASTGDAKVAARALAELYALARKEDG